MKNKYPVASLWCQFMRISYYPQEFIFNHIKLETTSKLVNQALTFSTFFSHCE